MGGFRNGVFCDRRQPPGVQRGNSAKRYVQGGGTAAARGETKTFKGACRFVQNLREGTVYADALWQVAEDYRSDAAIGEDRFSGRG